MCWLGSLSSTASSPLMVVEGGMIAVIDTVLSQLLSKQKELESELKTQEYKVVKAEWDLFSTNPQACASFKASQANCQATNILRSIIQDINVEGESGPSENNTETTQHQRNLHIDKLTGIVKALQSEADRLSYIQKQLEREISFFRKLQVYGQEKQSLPYVQGIKQEELQAKMTKRPSERTDNPTAKRTNVTMDTNRTAPREGNVVQASLGYGTKNISTNSLSSGLSLGLVNPQCPGNQSLTDQNAMLLGLQPEYATPTGNVNTDFSSNLCTPFPSLGDLAWGAAIESNMWGGSSTSILPSVTITDGVVQEVSRLLCHATVMELFQIQQLVNTQLDSISQFVSTAQPQPSSWDSGSFESSTFMGSQSTPAASGDTNSDQWQANTLDAWATLT